MVPKYRFRVSEIQPVTKIEPYGKYAITFWYEGENPLEHPTQPVSGYEDVHITEIERPAYRNPELAQILREEGEEAAVWELNRRIARYLVDILHERSDTLPGAFLALYAEKMELLYTWFWKKAEKSNRTVPAFLKQFRQEQKSASVRTWHNVKQAAEYLGCSESLIRKAIREGKLKASRHDPDSEKSTYSLHRKNLDGYMLFHRQKFTRPQMAEMDWLNS